MAYTHQSWSGIVGLDIGKQDYTGCRLSGEGYVKRRNFTGKMTKEADGYARLLDEIDDGCSPIHQDRLTAFLVEFLNKKNIMQAFVVNQSVSVSGSFTEAGMILLSDDEIVPEHCVIKSHIN